VDLVVMLERWEPGKEYDRLGVQDDKYDVLGTEVPLVRMPVAPGRNLALLIEVAARTQLLKERGVDSARRFVPRHRKPVRIPTPSDSPPASAHGGGRSCAKRSMRLTARPSTRASRICSRTSPHRAPGVSMPTYARRSRRCGRAASG